MATSIAKLEANRANAQLSTGPRSQIGREISSRNSEKHNLTGGAAFVAGEDRQQYETHCRRFHQEHRPSTIDDETLVDEMADATWRLKRARRMESELLEKCSNPFLDEENDKKLSTELLRLTRYIAAIERSYYKAKSELRKSVQRPKPVETPDPIEIEREINREKQNEPTRQQLETIQRLMTDFRESKFGSVTGIGGTGIDPTRRQYRL